METQGSYACLTLFFVIICNESRYSKKIKIIDKSVWVNKEFFTIDKDIGIYISEDKKVKYLTNRFAIHYSKKGVHIVPRKKEREEE